MHCYFLGGGHGLCNCSWVGGSPGYAAGQMVLAGLYIQAGSQAEFRDEIGLQVGLCGQVGLQAVCHSLLSEVTGGLPGLGGPAAVSDS